MYKFRRITYDVIPYVKTGEFDVSTLFYFWFIVVVMIFFGIKTRFATIVNYIFSILMFSAVREFEYHIFYAYVGLNF